MLRTTLLMMVLAVAAGPGLGGEAVNSNGSVVEAELNGLSVTIDTNTGGILKLEYDGPGVMLESSPERAGAVDLAYPIKEFEPLRLAAKYSSGARVTKTDSAVVIYWDKLGLSRANFGVEGDVSATLRLSAAPDGKSVVMNCEVVNRSKNPVRQVVFPDFAGLKPFAGADKTFFRTGGFAGLPFLELAPNEDRASLQYMSDTAAYSVEHKAGGMFHSMFVRWMDLGSLNGGISLFPKRWGWDPQVTTRLHLSEIDGSLRLLCLHDVTIEPGGKWGSGDFILTPHSGGWAKGIESYREWVKKNYTREWPVPKHIREGIGYRTTWMCESQPNDPRDVVFRFDDLPKLARECKEHGLDEMVLWGWCKGFVLPLPPPYPHLGTEQDMVDAIRECGKLGVNTVPFISVLQANSENAPRYGLKVTDNNGWTYHTELIPRWNPPYATAFACVGIPTNNSLWQQEVTTSCKHLVDAGIHSLSWDQYWATADTPNICTLTREIRNYAKQRDPESTFSGEELWNIELDSAYLDYTWNWGGYRDCKAFTSVFPSPRINCCVSYSPDVVRKAFADNLFLNVFPRKKESINGSDYIANYPELSKALKQCSRLRKQFLPYFTEGKLIGECILSEFAPYTHVCGYALPDRSLAVMINQTGAREIEPSIAFGQWIESKSGKYRVNVYDGGGKQIATHEITGGTWKGKVGPVEAGDIALVEITAL